MPSQIVWSPLTLKLHWVIHCKPVTVSLQSQDLMVFAAVSRAESLQHVQAADPAVLKHSSDFFLNASIAMLQVATSVMFGWGRLEGLQLFLISSSQFIRVSVRFVSCEAPPFNLPLHVRLEAFPPPFSTILLMTDPKISFFLALLPKISNKNQKSFRSTHSYFQSCSVS